VQVSEFAGLANLRDMSFDVSECLTRQLKSVSNLFPPSIFRFFFGAIVSKDLPGPKELKTSKDSHEFGMLGCSLFFEKP
jgi:hypothetical protein